MFHFIECVSFSYFFSICKWELLHLIRYSVMVRIIDMRRLLCRVNLLPAAAIHCRRLASPNWENCECSETFSVKLQAFPAGLVDRHILWFRVSNENENYLVSVTPETHWCDFRFSISPCHNEYEQRERKEHCTSWKFDNIMVGNVFFSFVNSAHFWILFHSMHMSCDFSFNGELLTFGIVISFFK